MANKRKERETASFFIATRLFRLEAIPIGQDAHPCYRSLIAASNRCEIPH